LTAGEATRPVPRGAGINFKMCKYLPLKAQLRIITYPDGDGSTLSALLCGQRVGLSQVGSPVSTTNRKDRELGDDDGSADGSGNFLRCLDSKTDVTVAVSDDNDGLESGTLTGTGLLLDGLDLYG